MCSISSCDKPNVFNFIAAYHLKKIYAALLFPSKNLNITHLIWWDMCLLFISSIEVSYLFLNQLLCDFLSICIEHTISWILSTYISFSVVLLKTSSSIHYSFIFCWSMSLWSTIVVLWYILLIFGKNNSNSCLGSSFDEKSLQKSDNPFSSSTPKHFKKGFITALTMWMNTFDSINNWYIAGYSMLTSTTTPDLFSAFFWHVECILQIFLYIPSINF